MCCEYRFPGSGTLNLFLRLWNAQFSSFHLFLTSHTHDTVSLSPRGGGRPHRSSKLGPQGVRRLTRLGIHMQDHSVSHHMYHMGIMFRCSKFKVRTLYSSSIFVVDDNRALAGPRVLPAHPTGGGGVEGYKFCCNKFDKMDRRLIQFSSFLCQEFIAFSRNYDICMPKKYYLALRVGKKRPSNENDRILTHPQFLFQTLNVVRCPLPLSSFPARLATRWRHTSR